MADEPEVARGYLVVRTSGAAAAAAAIMGAVAPGPSPAHVQLLMRCPVPRAVAAAGLAIAFADCGLHVRPAPSGAGVVLLTVAAARLSIGYPQLRPLMFQPVEVDAGLRAVFAGAVANVLATAGELDRHGLAHYLVGLAELVLRSALRAELNRADTVVARRREVIEHIRARLADPELDADRIAAAMFISRRRLYQLFDDGQGVSERIRGMRLDRAKALLADPARGAAGIGEISRECGFISAAHFSRAFRKETGLTPSEYRDRGRTPTR